eukprot:scaffold1638_cov372-Pavlova_lutheri.AAC.1
MLDRLPQPLLHHFQIFLQVLGKWSALNCIKGSSAVHKYFMHNLKQRAVILQSLSSRIRSTERLAWHPCYDEVHCRQFPVYQ